MELIGYDPATGEDETAFIIRSYDNHRKEMIESLSVPNEMLFGKKDSGREDMKTRIRQFNKALLDKEIKAVTSLQRLFNHILSMPERRAKVLKEMMMRSLHRGDITYIEYRRLRKHNLPWFDRLMRAEKFNKEANK